MKILARITPQRPAEGRVVQDFRQQTNLQSDGKLIDLDALVSGVGAG